MEYPERFLVIYDSLKERFEVIEDNDYHSTDAPLTELSEDFELMGEIKKAFEWASSYIPVDQLVERFRRDRIKADATFPRSFLEKEPPPRKRRFVG